MFTIRFIKHGGRGTTNYSATSYETEIREDSIQVRMEGKDVLTRFSEAFKWWFVLQPWEQALRVRAGRYIRKFEGGIHFRIPYLDAIFKQNCRLRISDIPQQTITNLSEETLTIAGALRYRVADVTPLFMKLHMAENTLAQTVQSHVADYIATHHGDDHSLQTDEPDEV